MWVVDDEGRLDIRALEIVYRGAARVVVRSGLMVGERVVTTPLAAPVQGMSVRLRGEGRTPEGPQ